MSRAAALIALLFAAGAHAQGKPIKIDAAKSKVFVLMLKAPGLTSAFSHDHVLRAPEVGGELVYDANNPAASRIKVAVKTRSIAADEPASRQRFGLQGQPSDRDLAAIEQDMKSSSFLDVEKFPEMTFTSTSAKRLDDGRVMLTGDLVIKGQRKTIELPVSVTQTPTEISGSGRVVVKQSDFGIKPCNKFLGAVKCADEVTLTLFLVGKP